MLSVRDMLGIKSIEDLELVAGETGLGNIVSSVNIMDNPEALDWLSVGEALLSTGFFYKDNANEQDRFLEELNNIGCPCLCIKPKRFLKTIPQNMIDTANRLGFPVIEIPYGISFSKIMSAIMDELTDKKDEFTKKSLEIHDEFFKISLKGGGLTSISQKLSGILGNPVMLLDSNFQLLDYCDVEGNQLPLSKFFELKLNAPVLPQDLIKKLPFGIDKFKKMITREFETGENDSLKIKFRIMPAAVAETNHGYIVLWQSVKELTEIDFIAIEKASMVFAMERIRIKELDEVKLRLQGNYFDDLITGKILTLEEAKNQSELLGINTSYQYYCTVVSLSVNKPEKFDDMIKQQYAFEEKVKQIVKVIQEQAFSLSRTALCFVRSTNIVILIGKDQHLPPFQISETKEFANIIYAAINSKIGDRAVKIGVGKTCKNILDLKYSFSEACDAIRYSEKFESEMPVCHLDDFLIYKFLEDNIDKDKMAEFFTRVLGQLYKTDLQNNTDYIKTLECYLFNNCNATEAAKQLFIHRNTFFYRIEKIKKILNTDLNNSNELFNYELALKIRTLY